MKAFWPARARELRFVEGMREIVRRLEQVGQKRSMVVVVDLGGTFVVLEIFMWRSMESLVFLSGAAVGLECMFEGRMKQ